MSDRNPIGRWKLLGCFVLAYLGALVLNGILYAVVTHTAGGFSPIAAYFFPFGLFVALRIQLDSDWMLLIGYASYFLVTGAGVAMRSRAILWFFVVMLLVNLGGCHKAVKDYKGSAWGARTPPATPYAVSATGEARLECGRTHAAHGDLVA